MRRLPLILIFALFLAIGLAGMAWISFTILRLDRAEADARRQALVEENVRLALWRMDSTIAPAIAAEIARPYFAYTSFTPAERAYTRMFNEIQFGDVIMPSPILTQDSPLIRVHFQLGPDGTLTSPQVPTGNMRDVATSRYTTRDKINASAKLLEEFGSLVPAQTLMAAVPAEKLPPIPRATPLKRQQFSNVGQGKASMAEQVTRSQQEYEVRNSAQQQANVLEYNVQRGGNVATLDQQQSAAQVQEGVMRPHWIGPVLVLARRVTIDGRPYIQGCWLDWPAIRKSLLDSAADLLPNAQLEPVANGDSRKQHRLLASIPVRLVVGNVPLPRIESSPIRLTLTIAWVGVLAASAAIALLLWGVVSLSERRAAFVSAVTHELRTPLTTVSMYAEMLHDGMVDESRRPQYLATLRAEADRLGHLVENVLAYSRIERGRATARITDTPLPQLIDGTRSRLAARAQQVGMELLVDLPAHAHSVIVRSDISAVEQILFNLVDNAAKYAVSAEDKQIHLTAVPNGKQLEIHVQDHGPGISPRDWRKLFRPFSKSARDAANSAPGVGLGLALSRRLARQMGGELKLISTTPGACFVLTLPTTD